MSKARYFVIGGGVLQQDFVATVKQMGFETHVFDYNTESPCVKIADVFHHISIDAQNEILTTALKLNPVAIQTVATEAGNITACYVGEKMGLCNNSYKTSLDTTDKSRMKRIFLEKGLPSARYIEISQLAKIKPESLSYPLVIKSADRSAGRGVIRANSNSELKEAFAYALRESHNKKVIVEECFDGLQYSVETISCGGQHQIVAITEETFDGSDNLIETRHMMPAQLSSTDLKMIMGLAKRVLTAFDVKYGAGHIEIKMTQQGPKIIEIASRIGGLRDFMVLCALGCDYNRLIINASLGRDVCVQYTKHKYVVSVFLISESDYDFYKKIKKDSPQRIVRENVHTFDKSRSAKNLMDSQGFFYLLFDTAKEAENVIMRGL